MTKQTKLIKLMLFILILIPIMLVSIAIVQTFVLKNKQNELGNAKTLLSQEEKKYNKQMETWNYMFDEEKNIKDSYLEDYYKHNGYNNKPYGNEGDIEITISK